MTGEKAHPRADGSENAPTSKPLCHGTLVKALARGVAVATDA